ncbi:MAG: GNAT family N-acetyltransferase [Bdellovibrio sp.]
MLTTLYRHYKNKPYRFLKIVKHSETMEDLVFYETLYDNPTARFWVRPKEMFFEKVKLADGREISRFEPLIPVIQMTTTPNEQDLKNCENLMRSFLGFVDSPDFRATLSLKTKVCLLTAFVEEKPVGFKLGYAQDRDEFYSWLGGVHPDFQRVGIASKMALQQQTWCKAQGYKKIRTKTESPHRAMLMLNLRQGFEVIGTQQSGEHLKILLEKKL